jgi:hypothetical protein
MNLWCLLGKHDFPRLIENRRKFCIACDPKRFQEIAMMEKQRRDEVLKSGKGERYDC